MMKKIIITGANGFVGSNLVKKFLNNGYQVTALIRNNADTKLLPPDIRPIAVNYDDSAQLKHILSGHDIIIHCAAITRGKNWEDFRKHNVVLTAKLVDIVNRLDSLNHFVFFSSQAASGASKKPKTETDNCSPVSHYGKSKLYAEKIIQDECRKNWTIIRPSSVYGEGDRDFLQYFKLIKKGISFIIGFKPRFISLISSDQLADYLLQIAGNSSTYGKILFLSDGVCYSWKEFVLNLEEVVGRKTLRIKIPEFGVVIVAVFGEIIGFITNKVPLINWQKSKEFLAGHWMCDCSNAQKLLNIQFSSSLKDNLTKTYEWYQKNRYL